MFIAADASSISVSPGWRRAPIGLVDAVAAYPVALIGDVTARMGMMTSVIRPQNGLPRFAGTVLPVLTRDGDNLAIHRGLDEAAPGDVLVVDAHAETNRAVFGDILGEVCVVRGVRGVVIDGATRDVDELERLGLPVFARAVNPAGPSKAGPGVVGAPVAVGNVVCRAGDAIVADRDGIVVLPAAALEEVLERLSAQDAFENGLRARIRGGDAVDGG
ncbi:RraA family protein [Microbacterium sp. KSW4-17]|uniref:Putative 4-hydroxy-4-methyl-2-oxoglutarate aldolase n=1 Tax=Microbacterium galbum TaxID=3075994 RepID=A0ABU3TA57_9MICO|nr:RraA family protein [Microbacterium sp. KSW4-17]MDU0368256.1 RraA family protein [Microbacterium sp. KSW4-17]